MKKHMTIKRPAALTLVLVLVLALVLAVPAMAAPSYQVRIHPNNQTSTPTPQNTSLNTRFEAYQIFKGFIDKTYLPEEGEIYDPPMDGGLSDVEWGNSISSGNYTALLHALIGIDTPANEVGVTRELLFSSEKYGRYYLYAPGLEKYREAYNDPDNWDGEVGIGKLTRAAEAKLSSLLEEAIPKLKLGDLFKSVLEVYGNYIFSGETIQPPTGGSLADSAQSIALLLKDFTNPETGNIALAQLLAGVLATKDGNAYRYLSAAPYEVSAWVEDTNSPPGHWTIGKENKEGENLQAGYYLIIDTHTSSANSYDEDSNDNDTAQSDFIMAVFGTQDVYVKTHAPTVDKVIVKDSDLHGADFEVGEIITFRITGTLPENLGNYDTYQYKFTDTLTGGLTYQQGSMKVYAVAPSGDRHELTADGDLITISGLTRADPASTVITFSNLKAVTIGSLRITADWKIVVEYQAKLNESADFENRTDVYLTYSSSSINSESTANTTRAVNYIYTFGIDVTKSFEGFVQDIEDEPTIPLAGAGFALVKGGEYALFDDDGILCGWIGASEIGGDNIDWEGIAPDGILASTEHAGKHIYFVTGADGKLNAGGLNGLKAGTNYALREVIVPAGYDKPEGDTTVRFNAEYFGVEPEETESGEIAIPGKLKNLSYLDDGSYTYIIQGGAFLEEDGFDEDKTLARMTLINYPSDALLDTGGPGTALFYIGGGALLGGAVLILLSSNARERKKKR